MNRTTILGLLGFALLLPVNSFLAGTAHAQTPIPDLFETDVFAAQSQVEAIDRPAESAPLAVQNPQADAPAQLVDTVSGSAEASSRKAIADEIRFRRARYRADQRLRRMERNLWAGYEPLRPSWNAVPMMSSRYRHSGTILVPVYIYPW